VALEFDRVHGVLRLVILRILGGETEAAETILSICPLCPDGCDSPVSADSRVGLILMIRQSAGTWCPSTRSRQPSCTASIS
jgi:hypothetical protein